MSTAILIAVIVVAIVLGELLGGPTALFNNPATKRAVRNWLRLWRKN